MEVKLIVTSGKNAGKEIPIRGPRLFIGRAKDCHVRPHSDTVSSHHCVIVAQNGTAIVRDLGSHNGTFVNGSRVGSRFELHHGDRIGVGPLEFEVRFEAAGGDKAAVDADLDLDRWLHDPDALADDTVTAAETTTSPRPGSDKVQQGDGPVKVAGVWSKSRFKPQSTNPADAADATLKKFFGGRPPTR
mgnify:CR=1 FL=1